MRRCPTCNRSYTDESLSFCLDDGSPLTAAAPEAPQDPQATMMITPENLRTMQEQAARQTDPRSSVPSQYTAPPNQYAPPPPSSGGGWAPPPSGVMPPAPKKSALPWIIGGVVVLGAGVIGIIVIIFIVAAMNANGNSNNNNNKIVVNRGSNENKSPTPTPSPEVQTKVLNSKDGVSQLTVPTDWAETDELNKSATIQAQYPAGSMYVIVITDEKANLSSATTLQTYADDRASKLTSTLTNLTKTGPESITVNGNPGLLYEIHGEVSSLKAAYLFAVVETSGHFHQIGTWTLESKFSDNRTTMQNVIESLREK